MNQNNSTWSGLQKKYGKHYGNFKEHKKEQRKKWNNKARQVNIQDKYTICFESGIDSI